MNTRNNKRRQASQEKMEKVFIELLQTKELSEITVSEIVKRTGLNRSTFYANYADIYELADTIREKLEEDVERLYENDVVNQHNSNDFLRLFHHIQDNPLFYKTYFKLGYDSKHKIDLYDIHQAEKFFDNKHIAYHMEFFKAGLNAIVKKWLDSGCRETPEEMSEILKSEYQGREGS